MVYENIFAQVTLILKRVSEDPGVPRNIRRAANEAAKTIQRKDLTPGLKAANAISILEEAAQDPNIPLFARTALWQAISLLEQVKD